MHTFMKLTTSGLHLYLKVSSNLPKIRSKYFATLQPALSVRTSVKLYFFYFFVLLFRRFWALLPYCFCPNALLAFVITAPAHQHATWVASQINENIGSLFRRIASEDGKRASISRRFRVEYFA